MNRDAASERQVQAADPAASTWLSANAGSGKTRVLTDRVARLLLNGVEPQRVLCLTYTKAAASEMQNRLFRRLGQWSMLPDDRLSAELAALGVEGALRADTLAKARRLFARAIETPGGLRIQTIHSFCASLLRRFPLEAGVSPQFTELDDRAAAMMRDDIVEEMADQIAPEVVAALARQFTGETLDRLVGEVARSGDLLSRPITRTEALAQFGLPPGESEETLLAQVFLGGEAEWLAEIAGVMAAGSSTDAKGAAVLRRMDLRNPDMTTLAMLEDLLLTGAKAAEPHSAKVGKLPTKATRALLGGLADRLDALMLRVEAARPIRCALRAAERLLVLHRFASVFVPTYAARKAARGFLDFDDLIGKARALLTDPSVAQWVLFRLDGGLDHILVDEAQDTSPDQWRVIELLAQEFTSGQGARDVERTIFVVGDKKQSIYSFQGADLAAFDRMKAHFRTRLAAVRTHLSDLTLEHSFRSSPAILRLVDLTFDAAVGRDLGGEVRHIAFKSGLAGRVDLWPPMEPVKDPEPDEWYEPVDLISEEHHTARLARRIADEIAGMITRGERIPSDTGPRPVTAGDVLILVQRRSVLFAEIIRACKAAGLPIAGADRLKLGAELAVKDLSALLAFLATPEDDLSLAAVLRSPLFGWSEAELFSLAQGRKGFLWSALRETAGHDDTLNILRDLRNQADFLRPHDLLARVLIRHDGRRKLLARLGDEAEDGIDALMSQALTYERTEIPSLTGFLGWLRADEVEVKRQLDAAGGRIRVMTVHGAKGLEAPIVILPETQDRKPPEGNEIVPLDDGIAAWRTPADESPALLAAAIAARRARAEEESLRLLYVALTRAQVWLIVAAAGEVTKPDCWYNIVRDGMQGAGAAPLDDGTLRLAFGDWPEPVSGGDNPAPRPVALPSWVRAAAPVIERPQPPLSPSDLGGAKVMPGEADAAMSAEAKLRGSELHLLLEHLPRHREGDWQLVAARTIADPARAAARLAEAARVLNAEGWLFGQDALTEAEVSGEIAGRRFLGSIDRLIVEDDRLLAVDFKSNRVVPDRAEDVPEGILRQMGAYAALLEQVYPARRVEIAVLWTEAPRLMPLPRALVMAALQRAGFP
jgi:ATP-dependent helicase/nuclease subunit A